MNALTGGNYTTADGRKIGNTMMEMKNITLRFGGVVAIKDISFDINEGEIRAIIGPNGAGKSSMLNVIWGSIIRKKAKFGSTAKSALRCDPTKWRGKGLRGPFRTSPCLKG